ncbi:hypothetical protein ANN_25297 [Periplaneta americana]|uniref:Uncharacterized protein n=1 Tax=Periplaneta americana TaxID=6978 RepID=A0ABQ8S0Z3_PERAM|nr:hypothetical protein ANN_25297 [Periplaneta americana]
MDSSKKFTNPNPRATANPISVLVFWWIKNLFWKGSKKDLEVEDLYNTMPTDRSEMLGDELEKYWKMEICRAKETKRKPRLLKAIVKTFGRFYFFVGILQFITWGVIRVNNSSRVKRFHSLRLVGGINTKPPASTVLKVASGVSILRLSKFSQGKTAAGQVVNLLSNDVTRFDFVTLWLHSVWFMPIQTAIITYFIWKAVGWSALIGVLGIFLQTVPVQSYLSKLTSRLRLKIATRTDERVRLMSEIISGIQVIKMYAWEKPFEKMVQLARRNEIKVVTSANYLRGLYLSTMVFSERSSLFITLLAYTLMGHHISADKVFAMAQFYNLLQLSMAIFYPRAVQLAAETKVSIKRLENFLLLEEIQSDIITRSKKISINNEQDQKLGITIFNGSAKWTPHSISDTLNNINISVKPGKLCAVIGPVGSGKVQYGLISTRAVYRSTDVYLLDDPLSAVDTHVGKHLYDECINTFLANKTRILVTHQLQYLHDADLIVILNNGKIENQGTYKELMASQTDFAHLLEGGDEEIEKKDGLRKLSSQLSQQSQLEEDEEDDGAEADENAELIAKGKLKASVYYKYFRAGGSICTLILLVLVLLIGQMASSGADYWVVVITEDVQNVHLLLEYRPHIGVSLTCEHDPKLQEYCVCPQNMPQFDSEGIPNQAPETNKPMILNGPTSRNREGSDQVLLVMSGILTMVTIVNYWLLIPMVIMGFLFYKVRAMYVATAQDIKRLEGITRSPVFSHLSASLNGLSTIRSSQAQELVSKEFDNHQDLHTSAWFLTLETGTAFGFWLDCISATFTAVVSLSFLILDDDTFGGNVGLAISQSLILNGMLQHGMRLTAEVINQMTSVERILEYTKIEKESDLETHPNQKPPSDWPKQGKIQFDHTNLKYSLSDPAVLKDLNFSIQPAQKDPVEEKRDNYFNERREASRTLRNKKRGYLKEKLNEVETNSKNKNIRDLYKGIKEFKNGYQPRVGIVGRTGAGKSSLISALFRLARLEGSIKVDNVDTSTIGLPHLRSRISIIPQEPVLFSASLRDNLDPFHDFSDEVLWRALEDVELKDSVDGLDFFVNEGGTNFSAGQRQLICLARAIIRNNRILVLDEATANVDPQTDSFIQGTIRTKFKQCTVLTIAHRLNTIMDSDMVLVMEAGEMVEFGHPHVLLQNTEGNFYKMVQETGKAMAEQLHKVAEEFERRFGRPPPRKATLLAWEMRVFITGSIKDVPEVVDQSTDSTHNVVAGSTEQIISTITMASTSPDLTTPVNSLWGYIKEKKWLLDGIKQTTN